MKQVMVTGPDEWLLADVEATPPGPREVRLRPISGGICGGDIDLLAGKNAVAAYPLVLGHECVAVVEEVGAGVSLQPGDHVAVYPTTSCGRCPACASGWANQCPTMRTMGLAHPNGCFTDTLTTNVVQCVPLPEDIAVRYGALIEPAAVGCHVAARAGEMAGQSALVIGVGAIGSSIGAVASARGAAVVVGADRFDSRQPVARQLGFTDFTTAQGDDLIAWVRETVGPVDLIFDTVGSDETTRVGLELLRPGGRFLAVASSKPGQKLTIPYSTFFLKEIQMITSRNYRRVAFEHAIALLDQQRPPLDLLITARYPLEAFGEAIETLLGDPEHHVKVILETSS